MERLLSYFITLLTVVWLQISDRFKIYAPSKTFLGGLVFEEKNSGYLDLEMKISGGHGLEVRLLWVAYYLYWVRDIIGIK